MHPPHNLQHMGHYIAVKHMIKITVIISNLERQTEPLVVIS
jgi:hypothetical protein